MRKILADTVSRASMLIARPDALDRVIKIAEPSSDNIGRTGLQGTEEEAGFVQSNQDLLLKIKTSGDTFSKALRSTTRARPGRFMFKSDGLYNQRAVGGTAPCTDDDNYMGREGGRIGHYASPLPVDHDNTKELLSLTVKPLKYWRRNVRNSNIENHETPMAMAMCVEDFGGGVAFIQAYQMFTTDGDIVGASPSYIWQKFNGNVDAYLYTDYVDADVMAFTYITNPPKIDWCELPDGSWFVAVVFDDTMWIYRSTDYGASFETVYYDGSLTGVSRVWSVACEYFNGRILICYSNVANTEIKLKYSDNYGSTWNDGDDIDVTEGHSCIRLTSREDFPGYIYLTGSSGVNIKAWFSPDGLTWVEGVEITADNASTHGIVEEQTGRKLLYEIVGGKLLMRWNESGGISVSYDNTAYYGSPANYSVWECDDTDGMVYSECDAIALHNGGFVDVLFITKDTHATTYYSIGVVRCKMWSGIQGDSVWDTVWHPSYYPSTSDAHPNVNHWTRFQAGTGVAVLVDSGYFSNLGLSTVNAGDDIYYQRGLTADAWNSGVGLKIEAQVVTEEVRVSITLEALGAGKQTRVLIKITETQVIIYDVNAAAVVATATPTNWDPTDRQEYYIVAKEDEIYIYRAPAGIYRECVPYELVTSFTALTNAGPGGTDTSEIWWGLGDPFGPLAQPAASEAKIFSVALRDSNAVGLNWDFDGDMFGNQCSGNPIGLLQGVSAKFTGTHVTKADQWELDTGAIHEADNIFNQSPSRKWKEPTQTVGNASPTRVFEWRRPLDSSSNEMDFLFDGLAVFGRNWQGCKLEGMNYDGSNASDIFDSYDGGTEEDWLVSWEVSAVADNVVQVESATSSAGFAPMIPGQFKSDGYMNWYLRPTSGSASGEIFKIVGNTSDKLIFDLNVEDANLLNGNTFVIFSSSFLFLSGSLQQYERLKLTINTQKRPVGDDSLQVGTVIIGRSYGLPDDEWGYSISREVNNVVVKGRSGFEAIRQIGAIRRVVNLSYSGLEDNGMGVTGPAELFRATRGGVDPVVWVDDMSVIDNDANKCHHNPLLALLTGNATHIHRAYLYRDESEASGLNVGKVIRGIHDARGFILREIL